MPKKAVDQSDSQDSKASVMDVSKPGQAEPNASSRPIIVTRKPIVQDPMVRAEEQRTDIPGPPVLNAKPSALRKFLTPKKNPSDTAADAEFSSTPQTPDAPTEPTVEDKIAAAKVKVEEADAKTIEEEKPEELKVVDNSADKPEVVEPTKTNEKTPKEESVSSATTGLPAAVKEMIEPEDVHISVEPASDTTETEAKTAGEKKVMPIKSDAVNKKTASAQKTDELKDIDDAPSEESAKALENAIKSDSNKDAKDEQTEKTAAAESTQETADADKPQETPTEEDPNKEQKSGGLVDELAKQAADKKSKGKEEKELSAKQQKINKLVEDKTYFLPIGEVTRKRKNRKSLVIFLLLLILLVGAYVAADAGFVDVPVELPIDLIQN